MGRQFIRILGIIAAFACITPALAASLPEFTSLARQAGPAVVNVSTITLVEQPSLRDFFPFEEPGQENPFRDFFDQFDRFFDREPGEGGEPQRSQSLGSGFIISEDGYIVTNNHVVADADEVTVILEDDGESGETLVAEIIGRDPETDLALLKVKADRELPVLEFGDSDRLEVGEWVLAIGNPFGLDHTVTAGIVSGKGRVLGAGAFDDFIQTDASINPGNSGGPLLNMEGEVVGINTAIVAAGQGIGFAVPSNMAREIIEELKEHQKVQRGWIGVTIQDVDENTAKALDLPEARGALIPSVMGGEPADKAGLKTGDVITEVNGRGVKDADELLSHISGLDPGEQARLSVFRKGKTLKLSVTLGERDTERLAQTEIPQPEAEAGPLGLTMRPVTGDEAREFGLDDSRGLLITAVEQDSPADSSDIQSGDVVLEANQKPASSMEDFLSILNGDAREKGVIMLLLKRQGRNLFRTIPLP